MSRFAHMINTAIIIHIYIYMYVCMYVCMVVCMYVCMYVVFMCIHIYYIQCFVFTQGVRKLVFRLMKLSRGRLYSFRYCFPAFAA